MNIELAYGRGRLAMELPTERTTVITPADQPGLTNERAAVVQALESPIGTAPLRQWIGAQDRICVVFSDITRATPNERIIPWLLSHLDFVAPERIVLLNATGTHRPNRADELSTMLTADVVSRYRVVNHQADNPAQLVRVGATRSGVPVLLNKLLVEAKVRIITGFIEPHFFAGFSGGPKGIVPGVAGLSTILDNHSARLIGHPQASFGILEGNPLWEELRDAALMAGPSFLLNVTLNQRRQITGVFAGDLVAAHRAGADFVRRSAMQAVEHPFEVVLTSNSGYPLDQNLYQGIKGLCAGARIVKGGGRIILACECSEGLPSDSPYERMLLGAADPRGLLDQLNCRHGTLPEQWQVQIQAQIQQTARVMLHSQLSPEKARAAHFEPCPDPERAVIDALSEYGPESRVAVLPEGPLTIPYLARPN
jgi:lactate racemase